MNIATSWIIHRFFSDSHDLFDGSIVTDQHVRTDVGIFEGVLSIVINVFLFVIKLVIAISINSIALLADAFHTLADSLSSAVIIISFKVVGKPADKEHPYGHGRAEYIATLILSMLIVVTGVELARSSAGRILSPEISRSSVIFIIVITATIAVKEILARISFDLGKLIDSDTLIADALHHRSDVFASLLAVGSMILANFGLNNWDGISGIGVGLFIIWSGYVISRGAIDSLLGSPPSREYLEKVKSIALKLKGVLNVHDIIVHNYGHDQFISLHIEIDEKESQIKAHEISETVISALDEKLQANITVHMDPVTTEGEIAESIKSYLDIIVNNEPDIDSYHDFRLVNTGSHNMILLDLSLSKFGTEKMQEKVKNSIIESLSKKFPQFNTQINVIFPFRSM